MRMEHVGKEVVIAIPVALVIQRNDKVVAALQSRQPRGAFLLAGDGIAERTTQPVENGGLEQEAADRCALTLQDLFDQIVHDVPMISGECPDEPGNILMALQG